MATPNRNYPEVPGTVTPDVPYHVNSALRAIDQDVSGVSARVDGLAALGGLAPEDTTDAAMAVVANNRQSLFSRSMRAVLDNSFIGSIRGQVAAALGSSDAPLQAAAAAVGAAASQADLITGSDSRATVPLEAGTGWAHPFTDRLGRIAGGFTDDGVFRLAQPMAAPDGPDARSLRTRLAMIGDSLQYGYQANGQNETTSVYLAKMFPEVEVTNAGYSGATVDDIRFRIGALPLYAEIQGGKIPASGPVPAIVKQKFGFGRGRVNSYYGRLAGVVGNLVVQDDGVTWTFERVAAGAETPARGKQLLIREDFYPNHTAILWMGRNDVSFKATGYEGDVVAHVVASIRAQVDHMAAREKQFGVVSILNMAQERAGSERHNQILAINARLRELYPSNYIDVRTWMTTRAIYDAGLTPTSADLEAMAQDAPPPQIMDGGSHPLPFMVPLLAAKFADFLNEKGYC